MHFVDIEMYNSEILRQLNYIYNATCIGRILVEVQVCYILQPNTLLPISRKAARSGIKEYLNLIGTAMANNIVSISIQKYGKIQTMDRIIKKSKQCTTIQ